MKKLGFSMVMVTLLLAGCTSKQKENTSESTSSKAPSQEIAVVVDQEMSSMDSALATDTYSITAINNVMEGLYRLTENNELEPAGAKSLPQVSEDGLTYTIQLNEHATWSDGSPVTADDYVFAWRKAVTPETKAEYGYLFEPVKHATDILAGQLAPEELGIKAVSEHELTIELEKTTPYFDSLLAFPTFFPQNEAFVTEQGDSYGKNSENLIYNGPFTLADFDGPGTDTSWTYLKNEDYWDKDTVQLTKIDNQVVKESSTSVNLFETGQADDILLTGELAKQYKDNEAFVTIKKAGTTYLSYNQTEATFKNENMRKAISYVFDREAIVNQLLGDGSIAPTGLVPSGMSYSPTTDEDFAVEAGGNLTMNIDEAKKLWQTAQKELGITNLTLKLVAYDTDSIKKVAEYLQSSIEENLEGIKVELSVVPVSVAIEYGQSTNFDLFLFGWTADYADPSSFLELFTTDSVYNYGKYTNPKYDQFVAAAKKADLNQLEQRWDNYIQAEKTLMQDMGVSPLIQKSEARLRNPALKGIISHSAGAQFDYKYAYLEE
ncbi:peptide ABC transporter substrate-binding protein [Candidatus Enterococcus willemsii]|uniref:Peptide ABC transporter substrate-binding protein n=1 Tax=Candidatus Enterococcus willemsii TaxID=1857215 RepID=A0ABQ6YWP3_9ENTE|nr:peptide ABC transporter substrate-binding protein [Enterococcus sp. CU12B]KAF1301962.1 peptide ABC transporter substrate-binding protein [Enterococcus sp. CU12B]